MSWPKPAPIEPAVDSAKASVGPLDQIARSILARYKPVEPEPAEKIAEVKKLEEAKVAAAPKQKRATTSPKKNPPVAAKAPAVAANGVRAANAAITPAAMGAAKRAAKGNQKRRSVSGPEALAAVKRLWERMNAPIALTRTEPVATVVANPRATPKLVAQTPQEPDPVEALKNFVPDLRLFPIEDAPGKRDREPDENDVFHLIDNDFDPTQRRN